MLGQHRSTQRKAPRGREDEERLTGDIIDLARQYGRYGYRRIAEFLRRAGWQVNDKRVERIWRREGLKVPAKHPKRKRLWLNDGSCIRLSNAKDRQNESEAKATRQRHADERQKLMDAQLQQRTVLQDHFKELRIAQARQLSELRRDVGRYLRFARDDNTRSRTWQVIRGMGLER